MLPKESNSRKGPSWIFPSDSYLLIYFYIHYFTHIQILPLLTPYWASSCINKMWLIKPYTFHHPKHWFSKSQKHTFQHSSHDISKRWSQPPSGAAPGWHETSSVRTRRRCCGEKQAPSLRPRPPRDSNPRPLASCRHAATELPACTLQRSSGSWVRWRVLPVLWISALCHVSGYNSSYDMMSPVTSHRRQDTVVFRIVPCSRFLSNSNSTVWNK